MTDGRMQRRRARAESCAAGSEEDGLGAIVVGVPVRLDGSPTEQTARVAAFIDGARRRGRRSRSSAEDERLTSREAESRLARQRARLAEAEGAARRRGRRDHPAGLSGSRQVARNAWAGLAGSTVKSGIVYEKDRRAAHRAGRSSLAVAPYVALSARRTSRFAAIRVGAVRRDPAGAGHGARSATRWSPPASFATS